MTSNKLALMVAILLAGTVFTLVPASPVEGQSLPLCTTRVTRNLIRVPASSGGSASCLIGDGLVGCRDCSAIRQLQQSLNDCHGKNLDEDGYWGPLTREALRDVQEDRDITPDGIYGPDTRDAMLHYTPDPRVSCGRF
ncbi:MAG: peptidoglycan-binding domain-containing protein [Acidimicrobiales bacterium]